MKKFDRALIPPAPNLEFETALWQSGLRLIAGVDEAGRGALAGPVAAGALILPPGLEIQQHLAGMHDSKKHISAEREVFEVRIHELALAYGTGFASAAVIDQVGIIAATRLAMHHALCQLKLEVDHVLVDYVTLPGYAAPQTSIVKGDERSLSIAGASILAKVARDAIMRQLDGLYPGYGFGDHKGYGTPAHRQAIERLGPCPEHRLSFRLLPSNL